MKKIFFVALAVLVLSFPLLAQDRSAPLRFLQTIPLSVDGRLDHLYADIGEYAQPDRRQDRLLVCAAR